MVPGQAAPWPLATFLMETPVFSTRRVLFQVQEPAACLLKVFSVCPALAVEGCVDCLVQESADANTRAYVLCQAGLHSHEALMDTMWCTCVCGPELLYHENQCRKFHKFPGAALTLDTSASIWRPLNLPLTAVGEMHRRVHPKKDASIQKLQVWRLLQATHPSNFPDETLALASATDTRFTQSSPVEAAPPTPFSTSRGSTPVNADCRSAGYRSRLEGRPRSGGLQMCRRFHRSSWRG